MLGIFFFFKQKTAYEMRMSDWSSDVCSSDLLYRDIVICPVLIFGEAGDAIKTAIGVADAAIQRQCIGEVKFQIPENGIGISCLRDRLIYVTERFQAQPDRSAGNRRLVVGGGLVQAFLAIEIRTYHPVENRCCAEIGRAHF